MTADPAIFLSAFLAASVEAIEALTLLLAIAMARGWGPVLKGAAAGVVALGLAGLGLHFALGAVPEAALHLVVGGLLVLFAGGWLRKAILRGGGRLPLKDQSALFAQTREDYGGASVADWVAGIAAFKAVLLEGLEVVFVIIAIAGQGSLSVALTGAGIACVLVFGAGAALRRPLARLPENAVAFWAGVLLMAFGCYWVGKGLGGAWPLGDWAVLYLALLFAGLSGALIRHLRKGCPT